MAADRIAQDAKPLVFLIIASVPDSTEMPITMFPVRVLG